MNSEENTQASDTATDTVKKNDKRRTLWWTAAVILLLLLSAFLIFNQSFTVLVRDTESRYYRAKKVALFGNSMLCMREPGDYPNRGKAMAGGDVSYRLSLVSLKTVAFIEIIPLPDDTPQVDTGPLGFPPHYLGTYRVNAAGNDGSLFIGIKNGYVYGFIRFPDWGKGVAEPMKGLRISGKRIQFVRSITSPKELNHTGANTYFSQQYYGEFTADGRGIQGFYLVSGQKKSWEAYRQK